MLRCPAALEMLATAWQANAKLKLSTMDYQLSAISNVTAEDEESDEALALPLEELLPWGSPLPEVLAMAGLCRSA